MSESARRVGLDVGGTAIKVGALGADGEVLFRDAAPLDPAGSADDRLRLMSELARRAGVAGGLGVGIAGLVDSDAGRVSVSPNLADLVGIDLRARLAADLGLPRAAVALENDANAAALGECRLGAARGARSALVVTLGTGIGGGLVLDGELFRGDAGLAGEIGHVVVDPAGPPCGCGKRGCVEALASGRAAARRAAEAGLPAARPGDVALLCDEARAGDGPARDLLRDIGRDLGRALAAVTTLLDLRTFVIGGGFGAALDLLHPGVLEGLEERTFGLALREVRVLPAALGADAGWIGAACARD